MEPRAGKGVAGRLDALYEYDREPVSPEQFCGGGYFAASFAGEHVAATEFVIGAMFVTWGAGIFDIMVGLALGNLLAVLSWALVCAPIAVETRLTLYWYLRRIGGPYLAAGYNLLNAALFCVLAGCMITVSASAVRIPFGIPEQVQWYPTHAGFVLVVLLVGAVVVALAISGFRRLAAFAQVCSPWMLMMFLAGCLVMIPPLAQAAGVGEVRTLRQLWEVGERVVWVGHTPDGGPPQIGFWHVAAFAWICNLAMHLGLSDLALFRFARRKGYGFYSAFGMFLGHYLAWIWAGAMGAGAALALGKPLTALDSGAVAFQALGVAGALAVVVAGWTTSNPTLYRAGLALQAVTPDWPRWRVTLVAGAVTTLVACLPFVFTRLLDFVGIYGLLLAPAGAIVVTEHWLFPRLGLRRYWAESQGLALNVPALAAWGIGIGLALGLLLGGVLHLFFLFLPVYLVTSLLYILFAWWAGAGKGAEGEGATGPAPVARGVESGEEGAPSARHPEPAPRNRTVRRVAGGVAMIALAACVLLPLRIGLGGLAGYGERLASFKLWLLLPTVLYFVSATFWRLRAS
jgi:cytosine permease